MEVSRDEGVVVFRAWQPAFNRHVAVQLLPGASVEQLEADARRTAALAGHPNVVTVHDFRLTDEGVPYLVSELLDDGSLADRLRRDGPLDWYEAARVTIKVAGVLGTARGAGVTGLVVTPSQVFTSRFGEPKVALSVGAASAVADEVDTLRSLLRALLTADGTAEASLHDCPVAMSDVLGGAGTDAAGLIRQLQQAQQGAGRPVTELPLETATGRAAARPYAADLSQALTVAPGPPARRLPRGGRWSAVLLVTACLAAVSLAVLTQRRQPTPTAAAPPSPPATASPTTAPGNGRLGPELFRADFSPGWRSLETEIYRTGVVDGEFRVRINRGRAGWSGSVWAAPAPESRLSVSITARLPAEPLTRMGISCGEAVPGFKFLMGSVHPDGRWEVTAETRVTGSGSAPERRQELGEPFVMRMECVTDRNPTRVALFLNDRLLGEADGAEPFPVNSVGLSTSTSATAPYEVAVSALAVHRLG